MADDWESAIVDLKVSDEPSNSAPPGGMGPMGGNQTDGGSYIEPTSTNQQGRSMWEADEDGTTDSVLTDALENPRERITVLKFEDSIMRFMRSREEQLDFPPLSSYHRLILHRLAARFELEHQTVEVGMTGGYDEPVQGNIAMMLFKTERSRIPKTRFIDISARREAEQQRKSKPKLLMKKRSEGGPKKVVQKKTEQAQKSVKDREREYAAARARIFGEEPPCDTKPAKPAAKQGGFGGGNLPGAGRGKGNVAAGPDSSGGFGRGTGTGRGRGGQAGAGRGGRGGGRGGCTAGKAQEPMPSGARQASERGNAGAEQRALSQDHNGADDDSVSYKPKKKEVVDPGRWKDSRASWRNRDADMHDPDFSRSDPRYDAYRYAAPQYRMVGQGGGFGEYNRGGMGGHGDYGGSGYGGVNDVQRYPQQAHQQHGYDLRMGYDGGAGGVARQPVDVAMPPHVPPMQAMGGQGGYQHHQQQQQQQQYQQQQHQQQQQYHHQQQQQQQYQQYPQHVQPQYGQQYAQQSYGQQHYSQQQQHLPYSQQRAPQQQQGSYNADFPPLG